KGLQGAIYSLLAGRDGSLWVGTRLNLARVSGDDLVNFSDALGHINSIIEDVRGTIWFSRSRVPVEDKKGPVCRVDSTKLRCYGTADGIPFSYSDPMASDSQGNLWIGSETLLRWKEGSSTTYDFGLKQGQGLGGVRAL